MTDSLGAQAGPDSSAFDSRRSSETDLTGSSASSIPTLPDELIAIILEAAWDRTDYAEARALAQWRLLRDVQLVGQAWRTAARPLWEALLVGEDVVAAWRSAMAARGERDERSRRVQVLLLAHGAATMRAMCGLPLSALRVVRIPGFSALRAQRHPEAFRALTDMHVSINIGTGPTDFHCPTLRHLSMHSIHKLNHSLYVDVIPARLLAQIRSLHLDLSDPQSDYHYDGFHLLPTVPTAHLVRLSIVLCYAYDFEWLQDLFDGPTNKIVDLSIGGWSTVSPGLWPSTANRFPALIVLRLSVRPNPLDLSGPSRPDIMLARLADLLLQADVPWPRMAAICLDPITEAVRGDMAALRSACQQRGIALFEAGHC